MTGSKGIETQHLTEDQVPSAPLSGESVPEFPGMELFTPGQAQNIWAAILDYREYQPRAVIKICEQSKIGWKSNGFPDTLAINKVERYVKRLASLMLAQEVVDELNGNLSKQEIIDLLHDYSPDYALIPRQVHAAIAAKNKQISGAE